MTPKFETTFEPQYGNAVPVLESVFRVTAPNGSPFTFHGTNSYLVGRDTLAVIDPGPDNDVHLEALLRAIDGRAVSHIFVTHTHMDHSPLAQKLKLRTGAKTVGYGPHVRARALHEAEVKFSDASSDLAFAPDIQIKHNDIIAIDDWALRAIFTPGHTANHIAFALEGTGTLFSGDHVMAWATTIVAPPDGSMHDYLASLDRLLERQDRIYFPGHGGPVRKPRAFVRALKSHRLMREAAILHRLKSGDQTISEVVQNIYKDTDPRLHGAAALTVFAHLERLVALNQVRSNGVPSLRGTYEPC